MNLICKTFFCFLFCFSPLFGEVTTSEEEIIRKIHAFFSIGDYRGAIKTLRFARKLYAESEELKNLEIRAIAAGGDVHKALNMLPSVEKKEDLRINVEKKSEIIFKTS